MASGLRALRYLPVAVRHYTIKPNSGNLHHTNHFNHLTHLNHLKQQSKCLTNPSGTRDLERTVKELEHAVSVLTKLVLSANTASTSAGNVSGRKPLTSASLSTVNLPSPSKITRQLVCENLEERQFYKRYLGLRVFYMLFGWDDNLDDEESDKEFPQHPHGNGM